MLYYTESSVPRRGHTIFIARFPDLSPGYTRGAQDSQAGREKLGEIEMNSKRKSDAEREKERLEALQKTEKKFLKGTFGDFFGKKESGGERKKAEDMELSFGDGPENHSADPGVKEAGGKKSEGRQPSFGDRIDELEAKGKEITSALSSRTDALQRANEALREVQSLLDNPLYDGMPSLTGKGSGAGREGNSLNGAGGLNDIDPGLMSGSDGDLFSGFAGAGGGADAGTGGSESGFAPDAGMSGEAAAGTAAAQAAQPAPQAAKKEEPEKDPMEELDKLIGLTKIKHDVKELMDFVKIQKMRKDGGLKSVPVSLHLVFTGNPGTGKTTVARILAQLYKKIGVLTTGQLVEVDRSGLVAGYVGQTALKTAKKIEEAKGGVLFIDEAYALARKDDTFGQESIDTILKAMEDNRDNFVVIVAGYTKPMENFINSNPGLKSRFNKYIDFPDYTIDELMGIFDMNCKKYDYEVDDDVKAQIRAMIVQRKMAAMENFANAREVRNLFEEIITNQARRVAAMENPGRDDMKKILLEDLTETAEEDAAKTMKKAAQMAGEAAESGKPEETENAAQEETETGESGKAGAQVETETGETGKAGAQGKTETGESGDPES